jgi:hypothetical protein
LRWEVPDKVVVAVGDGNIISGLWKGFNDLRRIGIIDRLPQLIGVQSETASAIVDAANGDGKIREVPAHTIADSINVGKPRDATAAIRAIRESGGCGVKIGDDEILAAIPALAQTTGIFAEPAAAAAYAGLLRMLDGSRIRSDESVLLVITGNGLKDVESARRAVGAPLRIRPDPEEANEAEALSHRGSVEGEFVSRVPVYTLTADEYLEGEKTASVRHEYIAGQVYAMPGASKEHNTIALNFATSLGSDNSFALDSVNMEAAVRELYEDVVIQPWPFNEPEPPTNPG